MIFHVKMASNVSPTYFAWSTCMIHSSSVLTSNELLGFSFLFALDIVSVKRHTSIRQLIRVPDKNFILSLLKVADVVTKLIVSIVDK